MSGRFTSWWRDRTIREQRLLLGAATLTAICFAWLLVVRPLGDAYERSRDRYNIAVLALAEARGQAHALRSASAGRTLPRAAALDRLVAASAAEAGFPEARVTSPRAGEAAVTIQAARPQALFAWIEQLEQRGAEVTRLRAGINSDRTLSVEVIFTRRRH